MRRYPQTAFLLPVGLGERSPTCPVHSLWPAIKARVHPGKPLFGLVNRSNFNRQLKAILTRMAVPQASRYSSHAFRSVSAQEMNETGSPISVVASAGIWRPNAVKGYIDLAATVEANVMQLFRVDSASESEKEVPLPLGLVLNPLNRPARPLCPWVSWIFWPISSCPPSNSFGSG